MRGGGQELTAFTSRRWRGRTREQGKGREEGGGGKGEREEGGIGKPKRQKGREN